MYSYRFVLFSVLSCVLLSTGLFASQASAQGCTPATITVTTAGDTVNPRDGLTSLREAITAINTVSCGGTINFNIPGGGVQTIPLGSTLPAIETAVTIDGYSQPGAAASTSGFFEPINADLRIEVRGNSDVAYSFGMICADGETRPITIRGLILNNSTYGVLNFYCDGVQIQGNRIGVDATGNEPGGTMIAGVYILNAASNLVGGFDAASRNHIAGQSGAGVLLVGSSESSSFRAESNVIINNLIGTNAAGDRGISGSDGWGVFVSGQYASPGQGSRNTIAYNVISGWTNGAVWLGGNSSETYVAVNGIGTDINVLETLQAMASGFVTPVPPPAHSSLANGYGVRIGDSSGRESATPTVDLPSNENEIAVNVIHYNNGPGIWVDAGIQQLLSLNSIYANTGDGINLVQSSCPEPPVDGYTCPGATSLADSTQNVVFDNGELGFDLGSDGQEDAVAYVSLTGVQNNVVSVDNAAPGVECIVEFYASDTCDPSGSGEAREYLGEYAAATCTDAFTFAIPSPPSPRPFITAQIRFSFPVGDTTFNFAGEYSNCISNSPPVVDNNIPNQNVDQDEDWTYTLATNVFSDPDGDTLTLTADLSNGDVLPSWLSFSAGLPNCSARRHCVHGTPLNGDVGDIFVRVTATDTSGPATVSDVFRIRVNNVNDAPNASSRTVVTSEDNPVTFDGLSSVTDVDLIYGDTLTITAVTTGLTSGGAPCGSTSTDGSDITFDPDTDYNGTCFFDYTVEDAAGASDTAVIKIGVTAVPDSPVANNDSTTINEGSSVTDFTVLSNDTDGDGDTLTVTITTDPSNGAATTDGTTVDYSPTTNFFGTVIIGYTVNDGTGRSDTATFTVNVSPQDDLPVAVDDLVATTEETPLAVDVLANDIDLDGDGLSLVDFEQGSNGAVTDNGDDTVTYTPNNAFAGTDTFTYSMTDGFNNDTATVTVNVSNEQDAPVANPDTAETDEETEVVIDVLDNDTDDDGDDLTITGVGACRSVSLNGSISHDGAVATYTPIDDFFGTACFAYVISDGNGGSDSAEVTVTVNNTPDAPVAVDDSDTTDEETEITISVLDNDYDVDGDDLTIISTGTCSGGDPVSGSVVIDDATEIIYTPDTDFFGSACFTYTITDTTDRTDTATVFLTVLNTQDAPDAVDDPDVTTDEETLVTVDVLANDDDVDGDSLTVTAVGGASDGTVSNLGDEVTYEPNLNFFGTDSFTYTISDSLGGFDTATVTVTVADVEDDPEATDDEVTSDEEEVVTIDVLDNDSDVDGDALTVQSVTQPTEGSVVNNTDDVTYTPPDNYFGTQTFTYTISDGRGGTATATVTVIVTNVPDIPVAVDDTASTDEEEDVVVDVLDNDYDDDGETPSVGSVTQGSNGTVTNNSSNVTYSPNLNFNGIDTFTYTIVDGLGQTDTATVTVTVDNVPDTPVAVNDSAETDEDNAIGISVLDNDSDGDDDELTVDSTTDPANGSATTDGTTVTYTPDADFEGTDTFSYTIIDGTGRSDTAAVTVTVNAENDAPRIAGLGADQTTDEDIALDVDFTLEDPDTALSDIAISASSDNQTLLTNANVVVTGSGSDRTLSMTPSDDENGTVEVTITFFDGQDTTTITFTLTVDPVNDRPTISDVTNQLTAEDTPSEPIAFTIGDLETAVGSLDVTVSSSDQGVVDDDDLILSGSGASRTLVATPIPATSGSTTITLTVSDGELSAEDTFVLTVSDVADAPEISDISDQTTDEDNTLSDVSFTLSDEDTPLNSLNITTVSSDQSLVTDGNISVTGTGANRLLSITPQAHMNGTVNITVTVDDLIGSDSTTFELAVLAVNDGPVITAPSSVNVDEDDAFLFASIAVTDIVVFDRDSGSQLLDVTLTANNGRMDLGEPDQVNITVGDGIEDVTMTFDGSTSEINNALNGLLFIPDDDFNGDAQLVISVDDRGNSGSGGPETDEFTIDISVDGVNDSPVLGSIGSLSIDEDTDTGALSFSIEDVDDDEDGLNYTAASSDTELIPVENIVFGGSGTTHTVTVTPIENGNGGPVTITVTVDDGDLSAETSFELTVDPVNDAPTITDVEDQRITEDGSTGGLAFTVGDIDDVVIGLAVTATSSNTTVVPDENLSLTNDLEGNWTINVTSAPDLSGTTVITLVVSDGDLTATDTFEVEVVGDNDAPTVTALSDQTIDEDNSTDALSFTVGDIDNPLGELTITADSSDQTLLPNENLVVSGSDADWTVVASPALNQNGVVEVTVYADDGLVFTTSTFTLTVNPVNDAPMITTIEDLTLAEDEVSDALVFTVSDVESLVSDLIVSVESDNTNLLAEVEGYAIDGTEGERTIMLFPTANDSGEATVTLTVSDGGLETATSFTLTVTEVNDAPVAEADTFTMLQTELTLTVEAPGLLENDTDIDEDDLTTTLVEAVSEGELTLNADGSFEYTPTLGYAGEDGFTYTVSDGDLISEVTTVTIEVVEVDGDADGISDVLDNCLLVANADQANLDNDDFGDVCDDDADGDGSQAINDCNDFDASVQGTTVFFADQDADGLGDPDQFVDLCQLVAPDGFVIGANDNCAEDFNPEQDDLDEDGLGDICDDDVDGDNILDDGDGSGNPNDNPCREGQTENCDDNCRLVANNEQSDLDQDGVGDSCVDDWDGDNIPNDLDQCATEFGVDINFGCPQTILEDESAGCGCSLSSASQTTSHFGLFFLALSAVIGLRKVRTFRRR